MSRGDALESVVAKSSKQLRRYRGDFRRCRIEGKKDGEGWGGRECNGKATGGSPGGCKKGQGHLHGPDETVPGHTTSGKSLGWE